MGYFANKHRLVQGTGCMAEKCAIKYIFYKKKPRKEASVSIRTYPEG